MSNLQRMPLSEIKWRLELLHKSFNRLIMWSDLRESVDRQVMQCAKKEILLILRLKKKPEK